MDIRTAFAKLARAAITRDSGGYPFCKVCGVYQNGDEPSHDDDCPVTTLGQFVEEHATPLVKVA